MKLRRPCAKTSKLATLSVNNEYEAAPSSQVVQPDPDPDPDLSVGSPAGLDQIQLHHPVVQLLGGAPTRRRRCLTKPHIELHYRGLVWEI